VVIMEDGLRPIGKPTDLPPYPTIMRALHFYPDSFDSGCILRDFDYDQLSCK